jgi:hypothetical protein
MKNFLIALLLVVVSAGVYANSRWVFVDSSVDQHKFYVDLNSFQRSGDSVTFWNRVNLSNRDKDGSLSVKEQLTINCRTRELITRYLMFYDDIDNKGKLTSSFSATGLSNWSPIAPDTINWMLMNVVCVK